MASESWWDWLKNFFRSGAAGEGAQAQERQGRTGSTNKNADPSSVETDPSKMSQPASQDPTKAAAEQAAAEVRAAAAEARAAAAAARAEGKQP